MKVLLTHQPGYGHLHPFVPLARALQEAGHEVAFATSPGFCRKVTANGFRCFPVGADHSPEELARLDAQQAGLAPEERALFMWTNVFAGIRAERSLPDLLRVASEWQPDVIVRDMTEFASCVAAERLGIPHAAFQVAALRPRFQSILVEPLNRLRESVGLSPEEDTSALYRYLLLSPRPPSFRESEVPPTTHRIRSVGFNLSDSEQTAPGWLEELPTGRPTLYVTLGTVFNNMMGLFEAILEGLRDEYINLIVTVGPNISPEVLGEQPMNVHVESYIPQSLILPRCDLVITHGGSGTVMDALNHGLPMVVIPIAADQPLNAETCARLGLGRVIQPDSRSPEAIREAAAEVLANPHYKTNAEHLRDEIQSLPGLEYAVSLLERLASERAPIPAEAP